MVPGGTRRKMILLLMIITPGIPEYLTGSSSLSPLLLDPANFLLGLGLNLGLYSAGALLVREFSVRFNKGWSTVLILGAAYGIMEEGISVHTFFQPSGNPVGLLGVYGRFMGVNWVWAFGLTVFHAVFSVTLPILLLSLAYRSHSREPLLGRKGSAATLFIYFFTVVILNIVVNSARPMDIPTVGDYLFFSLIPAILLLAAYLYPGRKPKLNGKAGTGSKKFYLLGLLVFPLYALYAFVPVGPNGTGRIPPVVDIVLYAVANLVIYRTVAHYMPAENNRRHGLYLAAGLVTPLLGWAVIMEFAGTFPLIIIVAVIAVVLILRLRSVVNADSDAQKTAIQEYLS